MTRLRQTIARRLKEAQNTAAMLTTFNDVDMSAVMELRKQSQGRLREEARREARLHGLLRAAPCVAALKEIPTVNAEIDGDGHHLQELLQHLVAVGTDKGLVVPVVRDADTMTLAEIEAEIGHLGALARDGKLTMDDLQGGTFTISNGGVYGSLMSTPILNPPQSGVLGMHRIEERPVVVDGKIVDPPDDVSRAQLRSPHRRRQGSGHLPRPRQGSAGRSRAPAARPLRPRDDALRGALRRTPRLDHPHRRPVLAGRRVHAVPPDPRGDGARPHDVADRAAWRATSRSPRTQTAETLWRSRRAVRPRAIAGEATERWIDRDDAARRGWIAGQAVVLAATALAMMLLHPFAAWLVALLVLGQGVYFIWREHTARHAPDRRSRRPCPARRLPPSTPAGSRSRSPAWSGSRPSAALLH